VLNPSAEPEENLMAIETTMLALRSARRDERAASAQRR
jgi:hypothetical protein